MMHSKYETFLLQFIFIGSIYLSSCKKFVEVDVPITSTSAELVFRNDASAISALNNIYAIMSNRGIGSGLTSMSLFPGLSADELVLFQHVTDEVDIAYSTNSLTSVGGSAGNFWNSTYSSYLFYINTAIEGLTGNTSLTPLVRDQLMGEAKFLRAFCYFYLVNLYGKVPLVLTTDYRKNSQIPRSSVDTVYHQIKTDLLAAQNLLNENYLDGTLQRSSNERITPNKSVATSLLSRVYLYIGNWEKSEAEASKVIGNVSLYDTVPIAEVFIKNNKEAIWQLQSVSSSLSNTSDASVFLQSKRFFSGGKYYLRNSLITSFEANDKRRINWIDSVIHSSITYFLPFKYKIDASQQPEKERTVIFRLAEQYLIRAEARLEQSNINGALSDLNIIRYRAGLNPLTFDTQENLHSAIVRERQIELFTEWGHRWLDLKRWKIIDKVLKPIKADKWQSTDQLYPIPYSEILINHLLEGDQNPGY